MNVYPPSIFNHGFHVFPIYCSGVLVLLLYNEALRVRLTDIFF